MKRISFLIAIAICCIALLGCGGESGKSGAGGNAAGGGFAPVKEAGYYADLRVAPNGIFLVRGKIKDEDADKSGLVYKVEMNDKKQISKITSMDGGKPIDTEWIDTSDDLLYEFASVTMEYQDGYVKYVFRNNYGASAEGLHYAYSIRYKYDEKKKIPIIAYLYDHNGEQNNSLDGFSQILFTYDDKGKLVKLGYSNKNGERVTTYNTKRYELKLKYGAKTQPDLPSEVANCNKDDSLMVDGNGIAKITYAYDEKGRLTEVRHFGTDESPKIRDRGSFTGSYLRNPTCYAYGAVTKYTYADNMDKPEKVTFYGKDDQPRALSENFPFSTLAYTYTSEGRIATVSLIGTDGMPCTEKDKNFAKLAFGYDAYGNQESETCYGKDGNIVAKSPKNGIAIHKFKYDDKRSVTEVTLWGTDGSPWQGRKKINNKYYPMHRAVFEFNDEHKHVKTIYYDKDGQEVAQEKF